MDTLTLPSRNARRATVAPNMLHNMLLACLLNMQQKYPPPTSYFMPNISSVLYPSS